MSSDNEQADLKALIVENQRLLEDNNRLLKKMYQSTVRHFWLNVVWIVFLLGAPVIVLYQFVLPMYKSISPETTSVSNQLQQINELRSLLEEK